MYITSRPSSSVVVVRRRRPSLWIPRASSSCEIDPYLDAVQLSNDEQRCSKPIPEACMFSD